MATEQRVVFTMTKLKNGQMNIGMTFHPPLAQSKDKFEELPIYQREMQNTAATIGGFVMKAMAERDLKKNG